MPTKPPVTLSMKDYINRDLDLVSVRVCGYWRLDPVKDFLVNREATDINGNPRPSWILQGLTKPEAK